MAGREAGGQLRTWALLRAGSSGGSRGCLPLAILSASSPWATWEQLEPLKVARICVFKVKQPAVWQPPAAHLPEVKQIARQRAGDKDRAAVPPGRVGVCMCARVREFGGAH